MNMDNEKINVIIAAGGTGGHIFPGVAIATEMQDSHPDIRIIFAGTERGIERKIIPAMGWELVIVTSPRIKGRDVFGRLVSLMKIPFSIIASIGIIREKKPRLLISIGGYAAGPLSVVAWFFGVPVVLMEPNLIPGMTNRILNRFAKIVFTAFEETESHFDSRKVIRSGTPIRKQIVNARREDFKIQDRFTVFLFGGSQGARSLNEAMVSAVKELDELKGRVRILHQTGNRDKAVEIDRLYKEYGIDAEVFDFTDSIWEYYAKADFVIARAGAGTVAELSALALPSALVPYPYAADDHQRANAEALAQLGGAIIISDDECTGERLAMLIREMVEDRDVLLNMRKAMMDAVPHDAAKTIVDESLKLIA